MRPALAIALVLSFACARSSPPLVAAEKSAVFGEYVGSTPCGPWLKTLFHIPASVESHLAWKVTLRQDPHTKSPSDYQFRGEYQEPKFPGTKSKEMKRVSVDKAGTWRIAAGAKANPAAVVYELSGLVALVRMDENVLQMLNPDRALMVGSGGFSYTLNRSEATEPAVDPSLSLGKPSVSYMNTPLSTGPTVFGIFEGRTPCQGIAKTLRAPAEPYAMKAKWRITLYQDAETKQPTTYKMEGSLYRGEGRREGRWSIGRGAESNPHGVVYQLEPAKGEQALFLLKGDDNVLFFLDQNRKLMVGHADFSYTLNRRGELSSSVERAE